MIKKIYLVLLVVVVTSFVTLARGQGEPVSEQAQLLEAAQKGDLAKVQKLIEGNVVLLTAKDAEGETPLHYAADGGSLEVVKYLLEKGTDINGKNNYGQTALASASYKGHGNVAEFLINKKIELNTQDRFGRTPLHYAAREGKKDAVKVLLSLKALPGLKDENGFTPLYYAIMRDNKDVVALMIDSGVLKKSPEDMRIALHEAAATGNKDLTDLIIKKGALLNSKRDDGGTLLHSAARGGLLDLARILLNKKFDVNAKDNDGKTPLHYAAMSVNTAMLELLISKRANVNAFCKDGRTPIHIAEDNGDTKSVELLLAKGASDKSRPAIILKEKARPEAPGADDVTQGCNVEVSYIANEGFMISTCGTKIVLDPLNKNPWNYPSTPEPVYQKMLNAEPPFDNVDLIILSHSHADHFNVEMAIQVLQQNPRMVMVVDQIAYEELMNTSGDNFNKIRRQVFSISPPVGEYVKVVIDGIEITFLGLNHAEAQAGKPYLTLGSIIDLKGIKLFHCADWDPQANLEFFKQLQLQKENIDILFVDNFFLRNPLEKEIIDTYIKPKVTILMHLRSYEVPRIEKEIAQKQIDALIFKDLLERKIFKK